MYVVFSNHTVHSMRAFELVALAHGWRKKKGQIKLQEGNGG